MFISTAAIGWRRSGLSAAVRHPGAAAQPRRFQRQRRLLLGVIAPAAVAASVPGAAPDVHPATASPEPGGDVWRGERAVADAHAGRATAAAVGAVLASRFAAISCSAEQLFALC